MPRTKTTIDKPADEQTAGFPLPNGYDDKDGPFFVPERIRDAWTRHAQRAPLTSRALVESTVRQIAEYRVEQIEHPERFEQGKPRTRFVPIPGGIQQTQVSTPAKPRHLLIGAAVAAESGGVSLSRSRDLHAQEALETHINSHYDEILPQAQHSIRLLTVEREVAGEQERAAEQEKQRVRLLCPVCHNSDPDHGGPSHRDLVPMGTGTWGKRIRLQSCAACYLAALDVMVKRAAAETVGDQWPQKTRVQIVEQHLTAKGL